MPQQLTLNISPISIFKAALVLIGIYLVYRLRSVVLVVLAAVIIASAIEPGTKWLVRHRFPRTIAVVLIYLSIALILFSTVYFALPPLLFEASSFLSQLPQYIGTIDTQALLDGFSLGSNADVLQGISQTLSAGDLVSSIQSLLVIPGGVFRIVSSVFGGVFSFILIIVFSFYFAVQERGIENFLHIITPPRHQVYVQGLWQRAQVKIGQWMQGQLLLMLIVGVLVFLGLTILGIKHAFLFALLAGFLEIIPLFGPVLSAFPPVLVAIAGGGFSQALIVAGLFIIIQQFENHLIYPLVVNKVVGVPAMVVMLALIIGGTLGGFLGGLLSVPLAAVFMELVNDYKKRSLVSETPAV
jgi:predicted PurR-regulated permease PerM